MVNAKKNIFYLWPPTYIFLFFSPNIFTEKAEVFSGIQTQIVGGEGKHADH